MFHRDPKESLRLLYDNFIKNKFIKTICAMLAFYMLETLIYKKDSEKINQEE